MVALLAFSVCDGIVSWGTVVSVGGVGTKGGSFWISMALGSLLLVPSLLGPSSSAWYITAGASCEAQFQHIGCCMDICLIYGIQLEYFPGKVLSDRALSLGQQPHIL